MSSRPGRGRGSPPGVGTSRGGGAASTRGGRMVQGQQSGQALDELFPSLSVTSDTHITRIDAPGGFSDNTATRTVEITSAPRSAPAPVAAAATPWGKPVAPPV